MIAVRRLATPLVALLLALPLAVRAAPGGAAARCDSSVPPATLPHLEAALAQHQLSLLVVAPAVQSPAGADTGQDDGSLPFRVQSALREQRPDLAIDLDSIDNTGLSLADVMPILADRLSQRPVALVIWQVGTAEIARGEPAENFSSSLADAVRLVGGGNADLLLVDPDPNPSLANQPGFPAIEAALIQVASHQGVAFYQQGSFGPDGTQACTSHGIAHLITHS